MPWWLLPAIIGGVIGVTVAVILILSWRTIVNWMLNIKNRYPYAFMARVVRERLASGNYRVHAGVFEHRCLCFGEKCVEQQTWDEVQSFDPEAQQYFKLGDKLKVKI